MRLPTELLQSIYDLLSPADFNAARHTCRSWYASSLDAALLTRALKQGGWWSSLSRMLPDPAAFMLPLEREAMMSKCLSRECNLTNPLKSAFVEVGCTDFSGLVGSQPGELHGTVVFTVSLCGRFLMAAHDADVFVYELNHVCHGSRSVWPARGGPLGLIRPVSKIICPRRVIACSMDTSFGRYSAAFLMEGRVGMVCDLMAERTDDVGSRSGSDSSGSPSPCICRERCADQEPPVEAGPRAVYRDVCRLDDPPRSVAICPQQNCVAFGCSAGIELHWVDALTGQDLSRWFPLTSPSDFLYFLSRRRGVDTARKLRLISSTTGVGGLLDPVDVMLRGFSTLMRGSEGYSLRTYLHPTSWHQIHVAQGEAHVAQEDRIGHGEGNAASQHATDMLSQVVPPDSPLRRISASSADHYRAIPLSDGHHILFSDPNCGSLCLGTDAPVGSLTRLLRKVSFQPPPGAASPMPLLYTAGRETRWGVRVVASFAMDSLDVLDASNTPPGREGKDRQMVMFYTVPRDVLYDAGESPGEERRPLDMLNMAAYPVEVQGQAVGVCSNLTELGLTASRDLIIWALSARGWARTWAMDIGRGDGVVVTCVQGDGSVRREDDVEVDGGSLERNGFGLDLNGGSLDLNGFDGALPGFLGEVETEVFEYQVFEVQNEMDAMSVDIIQEMGGITMVEVDGVRPSPGIVHNG